MLWYLLRRYIEGNQIRGLKDPDTRLELCSRERFQKNGKTCIVPKREMKLSKAKSPDLADACVISAFFLYKKGVVPSGATGAGPQLSLDAFNRRVEKINAEDEAAYSDEMAAFV